MLVGVSVYSGGGASCFPDNTLRNTQTFPSQPKFENMEVASTHLSDGAFALVQVVAVVAVAGRRRQLQQGGEHWGEVEERWIREVEERWRGGVEERG